VNIIGLELLKIVNHKKKQYI